MPYSDGEHKKLTRQWFWDKQPTNVLDIGAGAGIYIDQFKPVLNTTKWTAIDIFAPNLLKFELESKYDKVMISDVRYIADKYLKSDFTIMGDIVEHLHYADVKPTLKRVLKHTKSLLISLPIVHFEQGTYDGNIFETHHYHWDYDEMLAMLNEIGHVEQSKKGNLLGVFLVVNK